MGLAAFARLALGSLPGWLDQAGDITRAPAYDAASPESANFSHGADGPLAHRPSLPCTCSLRRPVQSQVPARGHAGLLPAGRPGDPPRGGGCAAWDCGRQRAPADLRQRPLMVALAPPGAGNRRTWRLLSRSSHFRDDYRGIARTISAAGRPGDAIVLNAPGQIDIFSYYFKGDAPVCLPRQRPG